MPTWWTPYYGATPLTLLSTSSKSISKISNQVHWRRGDSPEYYDIVRYYAVVYTTSRRCKGSSSKVPSLLFAEPYVDDERIIVSSPWELCSPAQSLFFVEGEQWRSAEEDGQRTDLVWRRDRVLKRKGKQSVSSQFRTEAPFSHLARTSLRQRSNKLKWWAKFLQLLPVASTS